MSYYPVRMNWSSLSCSRRTAIFGTVAAATHIPIDVLSSTDSTRDSFWMLSVGSYWRICNPSSGFERESRMRALNGVWKRP